MDIAQVYLEKDLSDHPIALRIIAELSHVPVNYINSVKELIELYNAGMLPQFGIRNSLVLARNRGSFLGKCPGTMGHICCNYYVIHNGINCIFNCSYCYLQFYANNPFLTVYINREDLFREIEELRSSFPGRTIRIGTGEFTDSLALDAITGESSDLVPYFLQRPELILELKTKSVAIDNLKKFRGAPNIVISWSLNPDEIVAMEEKGSAPLKDRLAAASEVIALGYRVAFHFDPIIIYSGWEEAYVRVIDELFSTVKPEHIAWISMGSLRYAKALKQEVILNHPGSKIIFNETVQGKDGKIRYFKPLRIKAYKHLQQRISYSAPRVPVYLCMELPDVWEKVFGYYPDYCNREDELFCRI